MNLFRRVKLLNMFALQWKLAGLGLAGIRGIPCMSLGVFEMVENVMFLNCGFHVVAGFKNIFNTTTIKV